MALYKIAFSGWKMITVEADNEEAAEAKFWEDGLNDLNDAEFGDIIPHAHKFEFGYCCDCQQRESEVDGAGGTK